MIEGDNLDTKRKYDLLQCRDCGHTASYPPKTSDGKLCPVCNSGLFIPIDMYVRPETRTAYAPDRINMTTRTRQGGDVIGLI